MGIFDIFNKKKNNVEKVEHKVPEYYGVTSDLLGEVEDLASKYLVDESMLDIYSKDKLEVKYLNEARQELEEALKEAVCHRKVTDMTENEKYQEIKRNVFDETQNAASPRMVQDIKDILKIR